MTSIDTISIWDTDLFCVFFFTDNWLVREMGYFFPVFYFSLCVKKCIVERCTKETFARSGVIATDLWPLASLHFLHKKWFWMISSFISHSKIEMSVIMEVEGSQEVKILVIFIYLVWNYFGFRLFWRQILKCLNWHFETIEGKWCQFLATEWDSKCWKHCSSIP